MHPDLLDVDLGGLTDGEIVEHLLALHGLKARLEGALVAATGLFDRRMLHAADAARTTGGWLAARVDQTRGRCKADVAVARALREMPVVEAAFREGRLGRAKVDLLVETRTPDVAEVFADQEAWLVSEVADLRVCDANRFLRAWHQQARLFVGSIDPDEPVVETAPRVAVSLTQTFEGRFVLDGEMDAEHGAIAEGEVLDAGTTIRLANRAQRRALRFRHARHCAFPGCDAPVDWCEAHHVDEWDPDPSNDRGRTDMANLVPLCRYHHHAVHEGGFTLVLAPDGTVEVTRPPDGTGRRCRTTPARLWRRSGETRSSPAGPQPRGRGGVPALRS